jgi:hypothetical protein
LIEGHIYAISRKTTGQVVYIGQTRQNPMARWEQHRTRKTPLSLALKAEGLQEFALIVIETIPAEQLNEREIFWITHHNTMHPNGLNHKPGGRAKGSTAALKEKLSVRSLATWADDEHRNRETERRKNVWQNPEYRAKMIASRKAMWEDPEFRSKMSEKRRAIMSDPLRKARQIEAVKNFWENSEKKERTRASISKAHKKLSENTEHRAALKAKIEKRWANAFL